MTLEALEIGELGDEPLPEEVERFLQDATERIEAFIAGRGSEPVVGFVPCDFVMTYRALAGIRRRHLAAGDTFLEWGSGFGVVADLAAMLGFEASGIEIEAELVEEAETLAAEYDLPATFVHGSFIPTGADDLVDDLGEFSFIREGGPDGYEELGLDLDDFDVVFVYPWPGEAHVGLDIFDEYAGRGSLLVSYRGVEEIRMHRKV